MKRIQYGNVVSRLVQPDLEAAQWMFEVVFDYDEGHYEELDFDPGPPEAEQHRLVRASASRGLEPWAVRADAFSSHRAGFEVRTYRRCRRSHPVGIRPRSHHAVSASVAHFQSGDSTEGFWDKLRSDARLIEALQKNRRDGGLQSLRDLARFDAADWDRLIEQTANGSDLPAGVPGKDAAERARNLCGNSDANFAFFLVDLEIVGVACDVPRGRKNGGRRMVWNSSND